MFSACVCGCVHVWGGFESSRNQFVIIQSAKWHIQLLTNDIRYVLSVSDSMFYEMVSYESA